MGNYVYTMRKKRVRITDLHNDVVDAVLFSYAYKPSYSFAFNEEHKGKTSRLDACAERAWDAFNDELVIVGEIEKGKGIAGLEGARVYKDVTGAFWTDCNDFPGTPVGFVKVEGRKLHIVRELPWYTPMVPNDRDFRMVVRDGKFREELRYHDKELQANWEVASSYGLFPVAENHYRVGNNGIDGIEVWKSTHDWQVAHVKSNCPHDEVYCWSLDAACALANNPEYQGGSDCHYCDGEMQWCSCCNCWTSTCCIDYGTCMCS